MLRVLIALFSMKYAYTIQVIYFREVRLIRLFTVQLEKSTFFRSNKNFSSNEDVTNKANHINIYIKYMYRLLIKHLFFEKIM